MKIYRVKVDVEKAQWIEPDKKENILELFNFDCQKKGNILNTSEWYVTNPKDPKANFFRFGVGAFGFDKGVFESDLIMHLEMAGEILTFELENSGGTMYVLNILECTNMLDKSLSEWHFYQDGTKSSRIKKYVFKEDRLTESSLFKIPETSKVEILTYTGVKEPDDEFYHVYHKLGFTGLMFEEIYSSES